MPSSRMLMFRYPAWYSTLKAARASS
jgi:hypothetical protein